MISIFTEYSTPTDDVIVRRLHRPASILLNEHSQMFKAQNLLAFVESKEKDKYEFIVGTAACIEFIQDQQTIYMTIHGGRVDVLKVKNQANFKEGILNQDEANLLYLNKSAAQNSVNVISFESYKIGKKDYIQIMKFVDFCLRDVVVRT